MSLPRTLGVLAIFAAAPKAVAGEPRGFDLRYEAPPTCPDSGQFRVKVARRLGHSVDFDDHAGSIARVHIGLRENGATAVVSFEAAGVLPNQREFETTTCDEAVEAAALVVALFIDPTLSQAEADTVAARPQAKPPPAKPPPASTPTPPGATPAAPAAAAASAPEGPVKHSGFAFGPALALEFGIAPTVLVAAGAQVVFEVYPGRAGAWAPRFSLSGLAARSGVVGASAERGTFTWLSSQLDGCTSSFRLTGALRFRPCVSAELGSLSARGNEGAIARPARATRLWASGGLLPTLSLHAHPLLFELGFGARVVIRRYEFVFENPLQRVYQVGNIAGSLEFSVGFEP